MEIKLFPSKAEMAAAAARQAADALRRALHARGKANVIAATGASQFEFLDGLVKGPGIDWSPTVFFHLDEYVGIPVTHPASFRRYLRERIVDKVRAGQFPFIDGDTGAPKVEVRSQCVERERADQKVEAARVAPLIKSPPIDVAFVGIGENGPLAFSDPPSD